MNTLLGVLMLASPLWPVIALGAAIFFYIRHCNRVERERRVPVLLYLVALVVCGGVAGLWGLDSGIRWACYTDPGNLCGLVGFLVVGPMAATGAIILVGLALSLIRSIDAPPSPR
jgi:hypothetical protein